MKVFISYQRTDALYAAHAVDYALALAGHQGFVDTGSIARGAVFPEAIANAISQSNLVFALMGPQFDVARLSEPTNVIAFEWRRARFHGLPVVPVLVGEASMPAEVEWPVEFRWFPKRNASFLRSHLLKPDIDALVAGVPLLAAAPRKTARVLWVDDRPSNNERERHSLRRHGIVFDNVVSTSEALDQLANDTYDLVITDLGREHSSDASFTAGATFIEQPALRRGGPPVIVYAGTWAVAQKDDLVRRGASDVMANQEQLIETVLKMLGRETNEEAAVGEPGQ